MESIGIALNWLITIGLVVPAWVFPRRLGLFGLLGCHFLTVFAWAVMGQIALSTGIWPDYDYLTVIGMWIQAFLYNCLLLPVSLTAMWRFGAEHSPDIVDE